MSDRRYLKMKEPLFQNKQVRKNNITESDAAQICAIIELSPFIWKYIKSLYSMYCIFYSILLGTLLYIFIRTEWYLYWQVNLITRPAHWTDGCHCHSCSSEHKLAHTQVRNERLPQKDMFFVSNLRKTGWFFYNFLLCLRKKKILQVSSLVLFVLWSFQLFLIILLWVFIS